MTGSPRILVMGCGGIGGIVTALLTEVGADVTGVTTNEHIAAAVRERGFLLRGDGEPRAVRGRISLGVPATDDAKPGAGNPGSYDLVLLATQPPQVEDAARTALPHLAPDGHMVVFQNGLCEARIAQIAGADRVIGAIVAWGAAMPEPGVYDRTAQGGFTIGRPGGRPRDGTDDRPGAGQSDPALQAVGQLLEAIGPVAFTGNLVGARWSKLAINCAISSIGTLGGDRLGPLVRVRRYRRLALEIMTEAVAVARAEAVPLEKVAGTLDLDWVALREGERTRRGSAGLTAKHALLLAVGMRYRRMRSSMLSAIERGRTPAVDFLNGEVVARAAGHGIDVPVNQCVVDTVHALARRERTPSRATLDEVFAATAHVR